MKEEKKFLFFAPHLSTGGGPAYLEWLIKEKQKEGYEVFVIEYLNYGSYDLHKKRIKKLVSESHFFSVANYSEKKINELLDQQCDKVINLIKSINPQYIHLNEVSDIFALIPLVEGLRDFFYDKNRKFKLYETCHNSWFTFEEKTFLPDEFWFCSEFHVEKARHLSVPYKILNMEIEKKERPNRAETLLSLGLNPEKYHVVQVGLFHENKNQKLTYEIAERIFNEFGHKVEFHFLGNECYLENCGIKNIDLTNCNRWGETDEIQKILSCMDLFVMPSLQELNPISIKEALSWGLHCYVSDIKTLRSLYKDDPLVTFIKGDNIYKHIKNNMDKIKKHSNFNLDDKNEDANTFLITKFDDEDNSPSLRVDIKGEVNRNYFVNFVEKHSRNKIYSTKLTNGMWASIGTKGREVEIQVINLFDGSTKIYDDNGNTSKIEKSIKNDKQNIFNSKEDTEVTKNIVFDKEENMVIQSHALGDFLAWIPGIADYAEINKTKINLYCLEHLSELVDKGYYSFIKFIPLAEKEKIKDKYKSFSYNLNGDQKYTLQETIYRKLNLKFSGYKRPKLDFKKFKQKNKINKKYVCIGTQSTAQAKYWNNPVGWKKTISYLKSLGYEVVCIDRYYSFGNGNNMNVIPKNCINKTGDFPLSDRINDLLHCEFFIGLGSGLSWLAWACHKPVVLISGFSKAFAEFDTPYRVINEDVCNGCWNDPNHHFDPNKWMWCPRDKKFECTKKIDFEAVKKKIDQCHFANDGNVDRVTNNISGEYFDILETENSDHILEKACLSGASCFKYKKGNELYLGVVSVKKVK